MLTEQGETKAGLLLFRRSRVLENLPNLAIGQGVHQARAQARLPKFLTMEPGRVAAGDVLDHRGDDGRFGGRVIEPQEHDPLGIQQIADPRTGGGDALLQGAAAADHLADLLHDRQAAELLLETVFTPPSLVDVLQGAHQSQGPPGGFPLHHPAAIEHPSPGTLAGSPPQLTGIKGGFALQVSLEAGMHPVEILRMNQLIPQVTVTGQILRRVADQLEPAFTSLHMAAGEIPVPEALFKRVERQLQPRLLFRQRPCG